MHDCINRPDTRLHPTNAPEARFATCNAGAIHTGHSLTATRMVARIESELGRVVPLKAVFEAPTLRVFAAVVEATGAVDADGEKLARAEALLAELDA